MSNEIEFKTSELSEGAAEMIAALLAEKVSSEAILMLARGYGNNVEAWKGCLECCIIDTYPAKKLKEPLSSLITEENLTNVCQVLKAKGLIKEFNESFKLISYLFANYSDEIKTVHVSKDLGFPLGWILLNVDQVYMEKRAESFNRAYDWCCSEGISERYNAPARTYIYEALTPMQYGEIIADVYGNPNDYCGYSTRCCPGILEDAKLGLVSCVDEIVRILMMGVEKFQF